MQGYFQIDSLAKFVLFAFAAFFVGLFCFFAARDFERFKKQFEIALATNIFYSTYYIGGIWFTTEIINSVVRWANRVEERDFEKRKRIDFIMRTLYSSITKESTEQTLRRPRLLVNTYNEKQKAKGGRMVVFVAPDDEAAYRRCLGFPARYAAAKAAE